MKKNIIPLLLVVLFASCSVASVFGQVDKKKKDKINWMTWEEVQEAQKIEKRKVVVDIYTEWCGWCKQMDKTTFSKNQIVEYINENFYAIKFDAEQKEAITVNGEKYKFVKQGGKGYHQLAADIMRGRLSYPTTVFLNDDLSLIQPIPGYLDAKKFEVIMTYFAEDQHKKTPWTKYQKSYTPLNKRTKPLIPEKKEVPAETPVPVEKDN